MNWSVDDFDYRLDESLIAQEPLRERSASRMMHVSRSAGALKHDLFSSFIDYLAPGDLLVLNNTKVFPARLWGEKSSGGRVECLIERICSDRRVLAHLRANKSPKAGSRLLFSEGALEATVMGREGALFDLEFAVETDILSVLQEVGQLPLPPYIKRQPEKNDHDRYQTVIASKVGAVAAPTASLHFDEVTLASIRSLGVSIEEITLHVGAGTFQPVRVENLAQHHMHSEWIDVPQHVCDAIKRTRAQGGRVIAVGTTVLRALETISVSGEPVPYSGETDIFIYPGFTFQCVDALLTNFHLPKSTLLMLVSAFAGYKEIRAAYEEAVSASYRFFSYGDCMLIS
jgi:S-adenosylmethionine:tRNA ribosyltransferase-isomerase